MTESRKRKNLPVNSPNSPSDLQKIAKMGGSKRSSASKSNSTRGISKCLDGFMSFSVNGNDDMANDDDDDRNLDETGSQPDEFQSTVSNVVTAFRRIQRTKHQQTNHLVQGMIDSTMQKMNDILSSHCNERKAMCEKLHSELSLVTDSLKQDFEKAKREDAELQKLIARKEALVKKNIIEQSQKIKQVEQMINHYRETCVELEKVFETQIHDFQTVISESITDLSRKIVRDGAPKRNITQTLAALFM